MPRPTVLATAVPLSAPTTFKNAAMLTACPGESTRVATDVAMALAVSWNPLTKSNVRPRAMITTRTTRSGSTMLEVNAFNYIRDVLRAIGCVFELPINLTPMHAGNETWDVRYVVVEGGQRLVEDIVGLIFEAVDLQHMAAGLFAMLAHVGEQRHRTRKGLGLLVEDASQQPCGLGSAGEPVERETLSALLGVVNEVIEFDREIPDIFAIQGCDKSAVESAKDAVGDLVTAMLQVAEQPYVALPISSVLDHLDEHRGHLGGVRRRVLEMTKELLVAGQKSRENHRALHSRQHPCKSHARATDAGEC